MFFQYNYPVISAAFPVEPTGKAVYGSVQTKVDPADLLRADLAEERADHLIKPLNMYIMINSCKP